MGDGGETERRKDAVRGGRGMKTSRRAMRLGGRWRGGRLSVVEGE